MVLWVAEEVEVGQWAFLLRLWRRWAGGWRWACLPSEWRRLPRPSSGWASVTSVHAHQLVYHPPRLLIAYSEAWPLSSLSFSPSLFLTLPCFVFFVTHIAILPVICTLVMLYNIRSQGVKSF